MTLIPEELPQRCDKHPDVVMFKHYPRCIYCEIEADKEASIRHLEEKTKLHIATQVEIFRQCMPLLRDALVEAFRILEADDRAAGRK